MCDYSIEMYGSRPAREDERYVLGRFPSGTIGVMDPGASDKAICFACDTRVRLTDIPEGMQRARDLPAEISGIFAQREVPSQFMYRDGVRLADGRFFLLQDFPPGVGMYAEGLLEKGAAGEAAKESVVVR